MMLIFAVVATLVYRSTSKPLVKSAVDDGSLEMDLVSPGPDELSVFEEVSVLVKGTKKNWGDTDSPTCIVKGNVLIESEREEADYC